jgi:hypothetical protein
VESGIQNRIRSILEKDPGSSQAEWEIIKTQLQNTSPEVTNDIMTWVLASFGTYTWTRVWAGNAIFAQKRELWIDIVTHLLNSSDPDDREVALFAITENKVEELYHLLLSLLYDEWTYIRLEAAEILLPIYPSEVKKALLELNDHPDKRIRSTVRSLIDAIQI